MFEFRNGSLHAESVPLEAIAREFGTPCYVYSRATLAAALSRFQSACGGHDALVCYAMKPNSNLPILNLFAGMGAGFDIVSGGELARVIAASGDPGKVIFSGVGKSAAEMRYALESGILCFNVESPAELARLAGVASEIGRRAPVSFRVNPDVDARTHPYISTGLKENKFGVEFDAALDLYREAARLPQIEVVGIDCHIGSDLIEYAPLIEALDKMLGLVDRLAAEAIRLRHLDLGGGLGIRYRDETLPDVGAYLREVFARVRHAFDVPPDCEITFEGTPGLFTPGRLDALHEVGVNRISVGAQTLKPHLIPYSGRKQRLEHVERTVAFCRAHGINC